MKNLDSSPDKVLTSEKEKIEMVSPLLRQQIIKKIRFFIWIPVKITVWFLLNQSLLFSRKFSRFLMRFHKRKLIKYYHIYNHARFLKICKTYFMLDSSLN